MGYIVDWDTFLIQEEMVEFHHKLLLLAGKKQVTMNCYSQEFLLMC